MKSVVILAVILVVLGAGVWWFVMRETMKDQGCWIPAACGNDAESTIEMHVLVDITMVTKDGPDLDPNAQPLWDKWVAEHFDLCDSSGANVPGTRIGWSPLVNDDKTLAVPEFYIKYTLEKGGQYTLDYIPFVKVEKPNRYRRSFAAPNEPHKMQRDVFSIVKEKE